MNLKIAWIRTFFNHATNMKKSEKNRKIKNENEKNVRKILLDFFFRMLESTEKFARTINKLWFFSITGTSLMAPVVPLIQKARIFPLHYW